MYSNPSTHDLLTSVAAFLRDTCGPALTGRDAFLARVAANAVEIAAREAEQGPAAVKAEQKALTRLLGQTGDVKALRHALCEAIRSGTLTNDHPGLLPTLEQIAAHRVAIEQPTYASLSRAGG